jgi:hypothetical protein
MAAKKNTGVYSSFRIALVLLVLLLAYNNWTNSSVPAPMSTGDVKLGAHSVKLTPQDESAVFPLVDDRNNYYTMKSFTSDNPDVRYTIHCNGGKKHGGFDVRANASGPIDSPSDMVSTASFELDEGSGPAEIRFTVVYKD